MHPESMVPMYILYTESVALHVCTYAHIDVKSTFLTLAVYIFSSLWRQKLAQISTASLPYLCMMSIQETFSYGCKRKAMHLLSPSPFPHL